MEYGLWNRKQCFHFSMGLYRSSRRTELRCEAGLCVIGAGRFMNAALMLIHAWATQNHSVTAAAGLSMELRRGAHSNALQHSMLSVSAGSCLTCFVIQKQSNVKAQSRTQTDLCLPSNFSKHYINHFWMKRIEYNLFESWCNHNLKLIKLFPQYMYIYIYIYILVVGID